MYGAMVLLALGAGVAIVCCLRKMLEDSDRENSTREETAEMQGDDGVLAILFGKTCGLMGTCMRRICCCCLYHDSMIEPEEVEMGQHQPKVCFPGTPAANQQKAPSLIERTYKRSTQANMGFDHGERQPLTPADRLEEDGRRHSDVSPGNECHGDETPSSLKESQSGTPKKPRRRSMTPGGTQSDSRPLGALDSRKGTPTRSRTPGRGRSSNPNRRDVPPRLPPLVDVRSARLVGSDAGGEVPSFKRTGSSLAGFPGTPANV